MRHLMSRSGTGKTAATTTSTTSFGLPYTTCTLSNPKTATIIITTSTTTNTTTPRTSAIDLFQPPSKPKMDSTEKIKSRWTRSFFTAVNTHEEKYICDICQKDLANPSNLALHQSTHVIERSFKCEPCQISFMTQGHLHKHIRSSSHENRVAMTQAFGIPTSENPRPYGCTDCDTAFRKHGHLAKHLRSKSHITKLETNGLIPNGTYAAFEKSSAAVRDRLVTTNCEQSLDSLRQIAALLFADAPPAPAQPTDMVVSQSQSPPPPQDSPLPLLHVPESSRSS